MTSGELFTELARVLGDRYRLERELGEGGMAVVYLAQDLKHDRRVAIKVLKPELSAVLGSDRFVREIAIAATLQHPHIVPLYDSGQAGALSYYVMPFVEGESLRQHLAREPQLPLESALRIAREVGSALQYAHEHGVVHRDIKPENIMLSGGQAVVADFGIARALSAADSAHLTATGMVVGTPQYMSPEQAGTGIVDGRSDQYSLACVLYETLTGQPPYTGATSHAVMARHAFDPVPSLRVVRHTVSPSVESAITRAMAKLPVDRFESVQAFLDALDSAGPAGSAGLPATESRSLRWPLLMIAGAAVVAAVAWQLLGRPTRGTPMATPGITTVEVMPFDDLGTNPDSSYLGPGMTEGLIADLAQVGALKVMASGASEAVVRGSIRRTGDSVQVHVRFLRARDSAALYSGDFQGRLGELPDLQRRMTLALTGSIRAELKGEVRQRLGAHREVNQRAYEAYLRGRFYMEREELEQARLQFEEAIRLVPDWAPPFVGLANYYTALPFSSDLPPAEVLPKARAALAQALALDETLAEAHAANAYIRAYYEWDWRAAEQEFRRALDLRPNYADAYFSYGRFLASRHRLDEAIAEVGRAVELDPLSLPLQANRALLDYFAGRYDQAEKQLRGILARDSTDGVARWGLALVAEQQGRPAEAIGILERVGGGLNRKSSLGHAYGVAGQAGKARSVLAELAKAAAKSYVPSYYFAVVHAGLGEKDQALRYLERAYQERSTVLAYLLIDPRLAPLRDDPRFVALARRLSGE